MRANNNHSWSLTDSGEFLYRNGKRVMECVLIRRKDNGKLALPGGFLDPTESPQMAAKRKFSEKALGGNMV